MSMIDSLNSILSNIETEIESVLTTYTVKPFLRSPDRYDSFPFCQIVPYEGIPLYTGMTEDAEQGIFEIHLILTVKTPFDYRGTTLLTDLDTLVTHLFSIRHDSTKWRNLDYTEGIRFSYEEYSNSMLQNAEVVLKVKK